MKLDGLKQVRGMLIEAKAAARKKGAFVMMVEQDLMLARFLAGLYTQKASLCHLNVCLSASLP